VVAQLEQRIKQAERPVAKANVDEQANLASLMILDPLRKHLQNEPVLRSEEDGKLQVRRVQSSDHENEQRTAKAEQSRARTDDEPRQWR